MMKKIIMIAALVFSASAAYAQWFDFSNNNGRFEAGLCIGQVGSGTPYEGVGIGASVSAFGGQLDYLKYGPQHKYTNRVTDTDWNDTVALCINLGYQFPVLPWFRVTPLAGYAQTNEGITRGNEMYQLRLYAYGNLRQHSPEPHCIRRQVATLSDTPPKRYLLQSRPRLQMRKRIRRGG